MATRQTIIGAIVCVFVAAFAAQSRMSVPLKFPRWERGMTKEEHANQVREAIEQRRLEKRKLAHEHIAQMAREAWKNELRVSERQWQIVEPKKRKEELVAWTTWARACS
ncbi:MAG: hypothetical protein JSW47_11900 [Phycisphaerales bacterium]|nr:MAG: hypothetical protein JSW47_11900 [Phycisphaerales bacterium]